MFNLFGGSIKRQVMKAIKARIKQAQKEHDSEIKNMSKEYNNRIVGFIDNLIVAWKTEKRNYKSARKVVSAKHVNNILNKVI